MNCEKTSVPWSQRRVLALVFVAITSWTAACGGHPASTTIWGIEVAPDMATATSGSAPGNEVDFSVIAHYSDGHQALWTGSVQWSALEPWVNLQNGKAICLQPAPLDVLNIPIPAAISATITTGGNPLTEHAALTCY